MCTETFLRLPEEKRTRFLDAAWEEFVSTSLADASINQIVRRAGIPRGSFYQYFADKNDLFNYLMEHVIGYLISEYRRIMEEAGGDIFRTQILCFDRVARLGSAADVLFERALKVVQRNPGLLPRTAMAENVVHRIYASVKDVMDVSTLRGHEDLFVGHIFGLTLVTLAIAVAACLEAPEKTGQLRQGLMIQLDIIRQGSLAAGEGKEKKEDAV